MEKLSCLLELRFVGLIDDEDQGALVLEVTDSGWPPSHGPGEVVDDELHRFEPDLFEIEELADLKLRLKARRLAFVQLADHLPEQSSLPGLAES